MAPIWLATHCSNMFLLDKAPPQHKKKIRSPFLNLPLVSNILSKIPCGSFAPLPPHKSIVLAAPHHLRCTSQDVTDSTRPIMPASPENERLVSPKNHHFFEKGKKHRNQTFILGSRIPLVFGGCRINLCKSEILRTQRNWSYDHAWSIVWL